MTNSGSKSITPFPLRQTKRIIKRHSSFRFVRGPRSSEFIHRFEKERSERNRCCITATVGKLLYRKPSPPKHIKFTIAVISLIPARFHFKLGLFDKISCELPSRAYRERICWVSARRLIEYFEKIVVFSK